MIRGDYKQRYCEKMKDLLLLDTKNVHLSSVNKLYTERDGVAIGSHLGPIIRDIFMVDLERHVILK